MNLKDLGPQDRLARILGASACLNQVRQRARLLATVSNPLLLQGETGVGKDVFARGIHESGLHCEGPFVALNCGGMSRDLLSSELFGYAEGAFTGARRSGMTGKIEAAQGGTLFLDEISEMPLDLQPYLLRVLEDGEVCPLGSNRTRNVRFRLMSACNRDLREEVNARRFRSDLFYRISVTSLHVPPLRDRLEDLPILVDHFALEASRRGNTPPKWFSQDVLASFARYSWPGNVRELRNVVEVMVMMTDGPEVTLDAMPPELCSQPTSARALDALHLGIERLERDVISDAIRRYRGNLTRAAGALHIARSTLYLKMKRYSLELMRNEARLGLGERALRKLET